MNERVNECIEAHARRLERSSMAMMSFGHPTPRVVVVVVVVAAVVVESFISPRGAGRPSRAWLNLTPKQLFIILITHTTLTCKSIYCILCYLDTLKCMLNTKNMSDKKLLRRKI